jgi:hypothetical protein
MIPALKGRHSIPTFADGAALTAADAPAPLPIRKGEPLDRLGRPGPYRAALSGLDSIATLDPGLRPGLCCAALSGLILRSRLKPRTSSWALLCRPFRVDSQVSPQTQDFVLGFAVLPFQG